MMLHLFELIVSCIVALGVVLVLPSLVLPVVYMYFGHTRGAQRWLGRYFRHDMALYSPFDLVYLYIVNDRLSEVSAMYRNYEQKGNRGSEHFVHLWVAAHQGGWNAAKSAYFELQKYTITNDVDPKKIAAAIQARDVEAIDAVYLIDMNGRAFAKPSLFRVAWALLLAVTVLFVAIFAVVWSLIRADLLVV